MSFYKAQRHDLLLSMASAAEDIEQMEELLASPDAPETCSDYWYSCVELHDAAQNNYDVCQMALAELSAIDQLF